MGNLKKAKVDAFYAPIILKIETFTDTPLDLKPILATLKLKFLPPGPKSGRGSRYEFC